MSGDSQGMAIALASSHHLSFRSSHTMDIETIRTSFTSNNRVGGGYFGRYQQQDANGRDMTDSTLSLEALAALLGPTDNNINNENERNDGDTSPPVRSHGFTAFKDSNPTPKRRVQSFPKINKLPTNQSPASHHKRKPPVIRSRSVRFADTQGLPLEIVKPLTSADPFETEGEIVPSLSSDLGQITLSPRPPPKQPAPPEKVPPQIKRVFKFSQPGTQPDFYQRLQNGRVCLESIRAEKRALHGIVRTINLSYEKQVIVRWTHDKWASYHDSSCLYCQGSSDGHTDRFSFTIPVNGDDIEFAICYRTQGTEYWDNNQNQNYLVALEHH